MGNKPVGCDIWDSEPTKIPTKLKNHKTARLSKILKSKFTTHKPKTNTTNSNNNNFIISYTQNNHINDTTIDYKSLDQRRLVFVSLLGLYQSWKRVPTVLLYSSIFMLPLKKKWILQYSKNKNELETKLINLVLPDLDTPNSHENGEMNQFISLLKWKNSQGLIFWMLDEYNVSNDTPIHSFWNYFSDCLIKLYDPITGKKYNPINIDPNYWKKKEKFVGKYVDNVASIIVELCGLTMKFNTIQEILFESNSTLRPVKVYKNVDPVSVSQSMIHEECESVEFQNNLFGDNNNKENWYFAEDYMDYKTEKMDQIENSNPNDHKIIDSFIKQFNIY